MPQLFQAALVPRTRKMFDMCLDIGYTFSRSVQALPCQHSAPISVRLEAGRCGGRVTRLGGWDLFELAGLLVTGPNFVVTRGHSRERPATPLLPTRRPVRAQRYFGQEQQPARICSRARIIAIWPGTLLGRCWAACTVGLDRWARLSPPGQVALSLSCDDKVR